MEVRLLSRSEAMVLLGSVAKVPPAKGGSHLVLKFGGGGTPLFKGEGTVSSSVALPVLG